jgi:hypothetical protein
MQKRIQPIPLSLPGLTRQSIRTAAVCPVLDARIKSGHDKQKNRRSASVQNER